MADSPCMCVTLHSDTEHRVSVFSFFFFLNPKLQYSFIRGVTCACLVGVMQRGADLRVCGCCSPGLAAWFLSSLHSLPDRLQMMEKMVFLHLWRQAIPLLHVLATCRSFAFPSQFISPSLYVFLCLSTSASSLLSFLRLNDSSEHSPASSHKGLERHANRFFFFLVVTALGQINLFDPCH